MGDKRDSGHFDTAYSLETGEQTRDHYASWAESYDREVVDENAYAQPSRVAEMLKRFMPANDFKILDAGCGSGLSGVALREAGYATVDGCDFSPEMLAKAREKDAIANSLPPTLMSACPAFRKATITPSPASACFLSAMFSRTHATSSCASCHVAVISSSRSTTRSGSAAILLKSWLNWSHPRGLSSKLRNSANTYPVTM